MQATTDERGGVVMAGMESGDYEADVVAPGRAVQRIRFRIGAGRITDIGLVRIGTTRALATCRYSGMYGEPWTIRIIGESGRETSTGESITYDVEKSCVSSPR